MTRRNQLLTLIRQAAVGSVPITLPPELQTEWLAVVSKYLAQTQAKRKLWQSQTTTDKKADDAARFSNMPTSLLKIYSDSLDATAAEEAV